MPYSSIKDLPSTVRSKLDEKKQKQFLAVFNSVFEDTEDEGKSMAAAWSQVNKINMNIIQKNDKKRFTLGVVYEPDVVDSQGDYTGAVEIEKACWEFTRKIQGKGKMSKSAISILQTIVKALDEDEVTIDITDIYEDIAKGGLNDMHVNTDNDEDLGDIVECYIAPVDFIIEGQIVRKGSWLMGVIWDDDYFEKIESTERTGFSMEGKAKRI